MRIMMSAAGSAVAPSIIRHLQSLGHYVIGHDCSEYGVGTGVVNWFVKSPHMGSLFLLRFGEMLLEQDVELYMPFLDEEFEYIGAFDRDIVMCSPEDTLEIFTSKYRQQVALVESGFLMPPAITHDAILKRDHGRGGKGVHRIPLQDDYLIQQVIEGDEYTIDVLTARDGAFLFAVPRLRIQANGVSVIGKIVMDDEIIDLAHRVVNNFTFAGPINIQVIRERDSGKLYIIEVNPRLSGSCMFTVMAGFDILDATIKLWSGKAGEIVIGPIEDGLIVRRHYVEERL